MGNIRMDLREIMWEVVDWIYLAQDGEHWRAVVHNDEPSGIIKGGGIS
jgi:hypothetical protein